MTASTSRRAVQRTITFNGKRTLPSALLTQADLTARATASSVAVRAARPRGSVFSVTLPLRAA